MIIKRNHCVAREKCDRDETSRVRRYIIYNIILYTINCELILRRRLLSGFAGRRAYNNIKYR